MFKKITKKVTEEAKNVVSEEVTQATDKWIPIAISVGFAILGAVTSPNVLPRQERVIINITNNYYGCGGKCHG